MKVPIVSRRVLATIMSQREQRTCLGLVEICNWNSLQQRGAKGVRSLLQFRTPVSIVFLVLKWTNM
jgi:hypothetical protein